MPAANLLYFHAADSVFQSEGGKLNIVGIFAGLNNVGTIGVAKFPATYPRLALSVGLSTTKDKLPIEITFRDADGVDVLPPFSGTFDITPAENSESSTISFNVNFDTFQLTKAGLYYLTLEAEGEELGELSLNVVQASQT